MQNTKSIWLSYEVLKKIKKYNNEMSSMATV